MRILDGDRLKGRDGAALDCTGPRSCVEDSSGASTGKGLLNDRDQERGPALALLH